MHAPQFPRAAAGWAAVWFGLVFMVPVRAEAGTGFLENTGRMDPAVRYFLVGSAGAFYLTGSGVVIETIAGTPTIDTEAIGGAPSIPGVPPRDVPIARSGHVVRSEFVAMNPGTWFEARKPRMERHHSFLGTEPSSWRTNERAFAELVQHDVWTGIDLVYRVVDGRVEAEMLLAPGVDPEVVRLSHRGADTEHPGFAPSPIGSPATRESVQDGSPTLNDPGRLVWSTFIGGSSDEIGWGTAVDSERNTIVVGLTISSQFPTTTGAYDESYNGFGDVCVSKFSAGGNLVWSTLLGGSSAQFDYGYAVTIDEADQPIVTGYTFSSDFPTTPGAYDRTHHEASDVFVAKLSSEGNQLLWSTFLGGNAHDIGYSVALDSAGRPVVAGRTLSADFPVTAGVAQPFSAGEEDGFVSKLESDGSGLVWSTYFGAELYEGIEEVALDPEDQVAVVGFTASNFFPTTFGVEDESWNGGLYDGFAAQFTADGQAVAWSRYLGAGETDFATALALDTSGNFYIAGLTESADFPTTGGAYDQTWNGGGADAFVVKLAGANGDLEWGTFLGGSDGYYETAFGLGLLTDGSVVVAGSTPSFDFPTTTDAFDTTHNGASDVFLSRLSPGGDALLWSSVLGGTLDDYGYDLALAPGEEAIVTGSTASTNFPTSFAAYDRTYNGGDSDLFLSRLRVDTTPASAPEAGSGGALQLTIEPNPMRDGLGQMRFRIPRAGDVVAELYAPSGRRIASRTWSGMSAGSHVESLESLLPFKRLTSGTYYLRIRVGDAVSIRALQIVR